MVVTATDAQTTGLDARDRTAELAAVVLRGHSAIPDEYAAVADPGPAGTSRAREIYPLSDEPAADAPKPLHSHHPAGLAPRPPHSTPEDTAIPARQAPARTATAVLECDHLNWPRLAWVSS
jgi:hypothetical protein